MNKLVAALIVRNEAPVIRRCLDSLLPHVDHIIVNDNGSTDNTPHILGEYCERGLVSMVDGAWVDFATNRNLVLEEARKRGDYVLCGIDADEVLVSRTPVRGRIVGDAFDVYEIELRLQNLTYPRAAIVKSTTPWQWRGVVQEGLYCDGVVTKSSKLAGVHIESYRDGARARDKGTGAQDLALLRRAVQADPTNTRYQFYLAQQYKDVGDLKSAALHYSIRADMGGFWEEVWASQFQLARIMDWQGQNPIDAYLQVHDGNPFRAEPLYYAADWCRRNGRNNQAFLFAEAAWPITMPAGQSLFMEQDIYDWRSLDVIAAVAWYTPNKLRGKTASRILMAEQKFPESERARIEANAACYTSM
jgi:glycosyltransferase involved in cell wall biosynthesis